MKLFLSSQAISPAQAPAFVKLVGKVARDIKVALIENAADDEAGDKTWLEDNRKAMRSLGLGFDIVDLNDYRGGDPAKLRAVFAGFDVIWLGGGNTYYLRWILKETGADEVIKDLAQHGKVYGGGSAGAVVAGPTLKFFETADDPKKAPVYMTDGLGLTDTVVVPHWQSGDYGEVITSIADNLKAAGYRIATITNEQALVVDGDTERIIG